MNRRAFFATPLALLSVAVDEVRGGITVNVVGNMISSKEFIDGVLNAALNEAVARRDVVIVNNERTRL